MIITGIYIENDTQISHSHKRIHWAMNEVQVTGENKPVRKKALTDCNLRTIEIINLRASQALVNSNTIVDDTYIAFANSRLISNNPRLVC